MSSTDQLIADVIDPLSNGSGRLFGKTTNGEKVFEHRLVNKHGLEVRAIDFGATITALITPDRKGNYRNIVLNYPSLGDYEQCQNYVGAVIGRFAGRISGATYEDCGQIIQLEKNENGACLHGGKSGFNKRVWRGRIINGETYSAIEFCLKSGSSDGGFPGSLDVTVRYSLTDDDTLNIEYQASTDATTHVNLTQHSYFNLSGFENTSIDDHELQVDAQHVLTLDGEHIPTGAFAEVDNTKFDFRCARKIGEAVSWLDHDFACLTHEGRMRRAGALIHRLSGRSMVVSTDQPSLHVYAGKNLGGATAEGFCEAAGLCLETQKFPNSPNIPAFPSTRLTPDQTYRHRTIFSFSTDGVRKN